MPRCYSLRSRKALYCLLLVGVSYGWAQEHVPPAEHASLQTAFQPRTAPIAADFKSTPPDAERRFNREWLAERGLTFSFSYTAEGFTTLRGQATTRGAGEYLGSADTLLEFDLRKLGLARGQLVVGAQSLHGRSINDSGVGAFQSPSNLDNAGFSKLTEIWYGDSYLADKLRIKIGRQYADSDFNVTENASDFLNSSYGLIPTILSPTYPTPLFGASVWTIPTKWFSIGAGVYQGTELQPIDEGATPLKQGLFSMLEMKFNPYSGASGFHGVYSFGVWQQSRGALSSEVVPRAVRNGGVYATADHWFCRANSAGGNSGPGLFLQAGWAPADRNEITAYLGGGVAWRGFLSMRPNDSVGVGITQAKLAISGRETASEIYYRWRVSRNLVVQPDLQWIRRPYGSGRSAVVAGMRAVFEI